MRLITRQWDQLQKEARIFPWKDLLLRMLADVLLVNTSMLSAFVLWFFFYTGLLGNSAPQELAARFKTFVSSYWLFWSFVALLVFHLNGFYTRTRGYASRYKAWIILQAVTLFMIIFVFADYLLVRGDLIPRGVALLGWLITLVTVGGFRVGKDLFLRRYRVQPTVSAGNSTAKRILVLGGAGYLGSLLVSKLLVSGYEVRVLDSLLFGSKSLDEVRSHPKLELLSGDVRDIRVVVDAMKGCDAVVHLAAIVGDPACEVSRPLSVEVNRAATRMLIDIARGYGIGRFIFASTCSVYGASDFLVDEHTQPAPLSTYAHTKIDSEVLLLETRDSQFHPTILRLGTLFGLSARPRFDLVVNLLVARATTTGKITIFNGQQWRPFLHVSDAARAVILCLQAPLNAVSGQIFNVGDYDLNLTLTQVSKKIAQIIPTVEIEYVDNNDARNYRASFDKIHRRLKFVCEKSLEDGIREIYTAISSSEIIDFTASEFNNLAITKAFATTAGAEQSSMRSLATLAQFGTGRVA